MSAVSVAAALGERGHLVLPIGIDKSGGWHLADPDARPFATAGPLVSLSVPEGHLLGPQGAVDVDVAFPVLHGPYGEDGTIQGLFEIAGIPYVGSGVLGSAVSMDKDVAKRLFRGAGLPIGDFRLVRAAAFHDDPGGVIGEIGSDLGYPVFAKPANLGSSVGISRASDEGELKDAIQEALEHDSKVLVEAEMPGREIEVAVLEGPRASVPGEIVVRSGWYTYSAKYEEEGTELIVPASLSEAAAAVVQHLACDAFETLECTGLARVDFFYQGGRGFILNEVNTMPGFTPKSMFPMMWAASGMPYPDLCDELVRLAMAR